jgi:hypothetical protein
VRSLARREQAYGKVVTDLLDGPASESVVSAKMARWEELLSPYIVEEIQAGIRRGRGNLARWKEQVQGLREYHVTRRAEMAASIER